MLVTCLVCSSKREREEDHKQHGFALACSEQLAAVPAPAAAAAAVAGGGVAGGWWEDNIDEVGAYLVLTAE